MNKWKKIINDPTEPPENSMWFDKGKLKIAFPGDNGVEVKELCDDCQKLLSKMYE